ncbi:aldo/keto reductase [Flavobacterium sp. 102]|uniref:aldo/keto reductase n=1 Tax=Flavobacterium sp. 102 TaxID=2135623 RepID=UPI000EB31AF3|nr:aldo/keto reductase [Flavobacterium sp. 102]RKS01858.1 aryl-alcohol dehydrogenase-like predicted oxidoreductase [Flavobacterium sp. 102]
MKEKLILGTVQFGINYGINNSIGMPSENDVNAILACAYNSGIRTLDTAAAYGLAENRIGNFHELNANQKFTVNTKFSKDSSVTWLQSLINSIHSMKLEQIDTIMFHSFESYLNNKPDLKEIYATGVSKYFKRIGVSVYTNEEMEALINDEWVSVVQLPFNLLDNHLKRNAIVEKLREQKKEIHTRSCFLQGLFFLNQDKVPEKLTAVKPFLNKLKQIAVENKIEMGHLALQYALSKSYIDKVLIGVDTVTQLENNIKWAKETIDGAVFNQIDLIEVTDLDLLNPSKW